MSISALNAGLSGIKSYQTALDASSHNVANASTKGFQPQSVEFQEQTNGGVQTVISQAGAQASANAHTDADTGTDLTTEMVNQIQYQAGFSVSAKIVKTADQMLGSLIDIKA